jgi:hypothetical protein
MNKIYKIAPDKLPKRWEIGQIVEGCSDLTQYQIVDQDEEQPLWVILRELEVDERVERAVVRGELKAEPKPNEDY